MRVLIMISLMFFATGSVLADDAAKTKALEKQVQQLEKRLAALETSTAPIIAKIEAEKRVDQQRSKARERMQKDLKVYSREQLQEIETLYQVANRKWRSEQGKQSLEKLIEKFDKANRTGCALLYLGQMSEGKRKENYLRKAIAEFSDCYYGNGVQVGAYARLHPAYYFTKTGQEKKTKEMFQEISDKYPDAIDHSGKPLADIIAKFTFDMQRFDVN